MEEVAWPTPSQGRGYAGDPVGVGLTLTLVLQPLKQLPVTSLARIDNHTKVRILFKKVAYGIEICREPTRAVPIQAVEDFGQGPLKTPQKLYL